jgi:hypothetical protein
MEDTSMDLDDLQFFQDERKETQDPSQGFRLTKKPAITPSSKLKQPRAKRPLSLLVDSKSSKVDLQIIDVVELRKPKSSKGNVFDASKVDRTQSQVGIP